MAVPSTIRYFVNGDDDLIVVEEVTEGILHSISNPHVLSDPRDTSSDPIDGWVEVTADEFNAKSVQNVAKYQREVKLQEGKQEAAVRQAYREALKLGFTEDTARFMSGYDGPVEK